MRHFSAEKWSDFVRNLAPEEQHAQMQQHLDSGCAPCRETVAWLTDVVRTANSDRLNDPPFAVVKGAHAIFRAPEPRDWMETLEEIAAELIFDTRTSIQASGVRAMETDCVRQTYRAGEYSIDMQIEPIDSAFDIVGQITPNAGEAIDLSGAIVQIVAGGQALAETETNQFGEFIIERPTKPAYDLAYCSETFRQENRSPPPVTDPNCRFHLEQEIRC